MWSRGLSRRAALLGVLALAGCGFAPVDAARYQILGRIAYDTPDTVDGFFLRRQLETRLGRTNTAEEILSVSLTTRQRGAAISADGDTTRVNLLGEATWILRDVQTDAVIAEGTVETFTSYSATGTTVATQAAAEDAARRLSVILADMVASRVLLLDRGAAA